MSETIEWTERIPGEVVTYVWSETLREHVVIARQETKELHACHCTLTFTTGANE